MIFFKIPHLQSNAANKLCVISYLNILTYEAWFIMDLFPPINVKDAQKLTDSTVLWRVQLQQPISLALVGEYVMTSDFCKVA